MQGDTKEVPKRSSKLLLVLLGIFIGIIILLAVAYFSVYASSSISTGNAVLNSNCREVQVPYETLEEYTEPTLSTDTVCEDQYLKYVDEWGASNTVCVNEICDQHVSECVEKNFWGNCVRYEEKCTHSACTKHRMDCSMKIENIDDQAGTWKVEGYSWNMETNQQGDFIGTYNVYINPHRTDTVTWSFTYNAGEQRSCWYKVSNIPTKQVCKDVIKNTEVTKTRSVVKYRTDTVCN